MGMGHRRSIVRSGDAAWPFTEAPMPDDTLAAASHLPLRPGDWIILLCGCGVVAMLAWHQAGSLDGRVVIRVDGEVFRETGLRLNRVIEVPGLLGVSHVEIRDGRVRIADDPGPRQLCVRQGWIPPGGQAICLPNRISVENAAAGYDTLSY